MTLLIIVLILLVVCIIRFVVSFRKGVESAQARKAKRCPHCGSKNITYQVVSTEASFALFDVFNMLFGRRRMEIDNESVAVCQDCGYTF